MHCRATRWFASLTLLVSIFALGCASGGGSSSTPASGSTSKPPSSGMATAMAGAASLWNSLGGGPGVNALANAFGVNLAANPVVAAVLGVGGIDAAKTGLVNTIAKAAGQPVAAGAPDLLGALSGKGLNAEAVSGVATSLMTAATSQGLKPDQIAALTSLWTPIGKSLLGG